MGYHRAGFDIVGVDIAPQPYYPFEFVRGDALEALRLVADGTWRFDAIHASPPCQAFTTMSNRYRGKGGPTDDLVDFLTPTRAVLPGLGLPYVIENVQGACWHMASTLILHGGMFGLGVHRPRYFESNILILAPQAAPVSNPVGVYGDRPDGRRLNDRSDGTTQRAAASIEEARRVMSMDWGDWHGVKEAIPPAYTEYIGCQLLAALPKAAAS
jgi:DNA (cytosine-5)-methyltransferase 1